MKPKRSKFLAWIPAMVVIGTTIVTASGISLIPGATAASTIGVQGTVGSSFSADPTLGGGGGPTNCVGETLQIDDAGASDGGNAWASAFRKSDGCEISYSSNNVTGAEVVFENNNGADTNFFCGDPDGAGGLPRACAGNGQVNDVAGTGQTIGAADRFGIALMSVNADGGNGAGTGVSAPDGDPDSGDAVWAAIPNTGSAAQLCRTTGPNTTTATCQFAFGGRGLGGTQAAGDYTGTLRVTAQLI